MKNILNKLSNIIGKVIDIAVLAVFVSMVLFFLGVNYAAFASRTKGKCMKPNLPENSLVVSINADTFNREDIVTATPDWDMKKSKSDDFSVYAGVIKRIIGLPGEHIEYKYSYDDLCYKYFINDEKYDFDYDVIDETLVTRGEYKYLDVVLGDDEYFLAGDNRINSGDSRCYGPVKKKDLKSKIIFSIDTQPVVDFIDGTIKNVSNVIDNIKNKGEDNKTIKTN